MDNTGVPNFRYVNSGQDGGNFSAQRRPPSISSAGYRMEPPPPYPGPPPPPTLPAADSNQPLQPFYLWSGTMLPGQVPVIVEQPRPMPPYASSLPSPSQYQIRPSVRMAAVQSPVLSYRQHPSDHHVIVRQNSSNYCNSWICTLAVVTVCCVLQGNVLALVCLLPSICCACRARSSGASEEWKAYSKVFCWLGIMEYLLIIGAGAAYGIYYIVKHFGQ